MNEFVESPQGEDYAAAARESLERGDLAEAMNLVAAALTFAPTREDWLELVDEVARQADDPLKLVDIEEPAFFGRLALRALLLAKQRRYPEALALQFEVAAFRPDVAYLPWARLYFANARVSDADLSLIGPKLSAYVRALPSSIPEQASERANAEAALEIVRLLRRAFPRQEQLAYFEGLVLRRLGNLEDARRVALDDLKEMPSWFTAIGVAASCRELGLLEDALQHYQLALRFAPRDVPTHVDMADLLLDSQKYAQAQSTYSKALELEPGHAWANASKVFSQYHLTGERSHLELLERLAAGGNLRAIDLLQR